MAGIYVDQEEETCLKWRVNFDGTGTNLTLHLYSNNKTPADADTEASYTEATFTGYAAKTLTGSSFVITGGAPSTAVYAKQTFTSSADQAIQYCYGYFLKRGTKLVGAERFSDGPYAIVNNLDYIDVTPTLQEKKAGE